MTKPYRADLVGSFLRPAELKQAHQDFLAGKLSNAREVQIQHEAIKDLVQKQAAAGFTAVTDGEFSRQYWHLDFLWGLLGVEKLNNVKYERNFKGNINTADNVTLTGKIAANPNHPFYDAFEFLQSVTPTGHEPKFTIPSPALLLRDHRSDNWHEFYANYADYAQAIAQAYIDTIQHFYDLGLRYLQIDDTNWAFLIDNLKRNEGDPEAQKPFVDLAQTAHDIIKNVLAHKPADLTIASHICRGNFQSTFLFAGGYEYVADYIKDLPYDGLFLEYDNERSGGFAPLATLWNGDQHKRIVLGLITSKFADLEDPAAVEARIQAATQYVPLENLAISTQCGFASTEQGNKITDADQWAKLALVQQVAQATWKD
nr:vitamin B12 independent methionine synthase [Lacticaseibacillus baoqingensis]